MTGNRRHARWRGLHAVLTLASMLSAFAGALHAHEVRPAYLQLRETEAGIFDVAWKQPLNAGRRLRLDPELPPHCRRTREVPPEVVTGNAGALLERWVADCRRDDGQDALIGHGVSIAGLERTITDVLLQIERLDGTSVRALLKPNSPRFEIGAESSAGVPAYLILGVEHLLFGFDHILFVIGLLFFVRSPLLLVQTITAFTVAHSITLALSTLGLMRLSQGPVEAIIALSILFLAVELMRPVEERSPLTRSRPWLFAFVFGLLHGFGFAGALADIGLPEDAIALALLLFNVGVELGQLMVVAVVLAGLWLLGSRIERLPKWVQQTPIWAMGSISAFWFVERTVGLISG